jgi:hypothetical protein
MSNNLRFENTIIVCFSCLWTSIWISRSLIGLELERTFAAQSLFTRDQVGFTNGHPLSIVMGVSQARWMVFVMENPFLKCMMTGGTPISGNLHMNPYEYWSLRTRQESSWHPCLIDEFPVLPLRSTEAGTAEAVCQTSAKMFYTMFGIYFLYILCN